LLHCFIWDDVVNIWDRIQRCRLLSMLILYAVLSSADLVETSVCG